uniref:Uncharacterized protein n=1 Tax=viral metagenome TaxID=1070528 RepID=A0A6M3L6V9_9ZZZZ
MFNTIPFFEKPSDGGGSALTVEQLQAQLQAEQEKNTTLQRSMDNKDQAAARLQQERDQLRKVNEDVLNDFNSLRTPGNFTVGNVAKFLNISEAEVKTLAGDKSLASDDTIDSGDVSGTATKRLETAFDAKLAQITRDYDAKIKKIEQERETDKQQSQKERGELFRSNVHQAVVKEAGKDAPKELHDAAYKLAIVNCSHMGLDAGMEQTRKDIKMLTDVELKKQNQKLKNISDDDDVPARPELPAFGEKDKKFKSRADVVEATHKRMTQYVQQKSRAS